MTSKEPAEKLCGISVAGRDGNIRLKRSVRRRDKWDGGIGFVAEDLEQVQGNRSRRIPFCAAL